MAILGGLVLSALILLICVSIVGRTIGIGPINGDYELVEAGIAFSIFAFLPLTQITAGHATVDIFTNSLPPKIQRLLLAVIEIFFAAMLIMVAWQLREGCLTNSNADKQHSFFNSLFGGPMPLAFLAHLPPQSLQPTQHSHAFMKRSQVPKYLKQRGRSIEQS